MVLGTRGPRSMAAKATCWAVLGSMVIGQWQLAYAGLAPMHTMGKNSPADVIGGAQAPEGRIERLIPVRLSSADARIDASLVAQLFDERAGLGLIASEPVRFYAQLPEAAAIRTIGVYGDADGALALISDGPNGREQVFDLRQNEPRWNRFPVADGQVGTLLTLEWRPARPGAMLRELELWGQTAKAKSSMDKPFRLPEALYSGVPAGAREFKAPGSDLPVSVATVTAGGEAGIFTANLNESLRAFARVFLAYDLNGLAHYTAAPRTINGKALAARAGTIHKGGGAQVEEISPRWLQPGKNTIQFLPADGSDPAGYRVSNVRLIAVPGPQSTLSEQGSEIWQQLSDGKVETQWLASRGKALDLRDWTFDSVAQPEAVEVHLSQPGNASLQAFAGDRRRNAKVSLDLAGLSAGWHRFSLSGLPPAQKVSFAFHANKEQGAAISELKVTASPLPTDVAPRIQISYPLSGECVDHQIYVRGFVDPEGPATLFVNGSRMDEALASDGRLAFEISERRAGARAGKPFQVQIEARFPGGARAATSIPIAGCVDRPGIVKGEDGRPRQPIEDVGAPYSEIVRAKSPSTLAYGDATIEVPAGAVERDLRVSIRPLDTDKVPPLDAGMVNVTTGQRAFRFGPHGMVFKRPVKVSLPFDKAKLPPGFTEQDVRTFYYDEHSKHWEQVGLLSASNDKLVALSGHFTDFVNATIAMPENPGTQSLNPTSLKDIKAANPAAGITLIQPPVANSRGTANLSYPIELPPGRHGMQPQLAISYDSNGGNGWLGVGWNLSLPSIEIDTRFGTPKYDGTDTYLLDGAMLTPLVDAYGQALTPDGAPAINGTYFRRRVEGTFDWIARMENNNGGYYWVVTDKNGVTYTYGSSSDARLQSPTEPNHVFRWHLENVHDPYGNEIKYTYRSSNHATAGVNGSADLPWRQVYPDRISYTEGNGLKAAYSVVFHSEADGHFGFGKRADIISNARSGFDVRTTELLYEVEVRYEAGNATIRRYHLFYKKGAFGKTVLSSIGLYGPDAVVPTALSSGRLYEHRFWYTTAPQSGDTVQAFEAAKPFGTMWNGNGTKRTSGALNRTDDSMKGVSGGLSLTLPGVGSLGVNGGGNWGDEYSSWEFQDLNGDGIPDGIASDGTREIGAPMCLNNTYSPITAPSVGDLSHTDRSSWTVGGMLSGFGVGANVQHTWGETSDDKILADIDGDGFTDLVWVEDGNISVRRGDWQGVLGATEVKSPLDLTGMKLEGGDYEATKTVEPSRVGPLIRWIAPYTGSVLLDGSVTKTKAGGDGVIVYVYRQRKDGGPTMIWGHRIEGNDTRSCVPEGGAGCDSGPGKLIDVVAGDTYYMLVDGLSTTNGDDIQWSPRFTYQGVDAGLKEPTGTPMYVFSQLNDFALAGEPGLPWKADSDGTVSVSWTLAKMPTCDDVKLSIERVRSDGTKDPVIQPIQRSAAWDSSGNPEVGSQPFDVYAGDIITFKVESQSEIDPALVHWAPKVSYTNYCRADLEGGAKICGKPIPVERGGYRIEGDPDPSFVVPAAIIDQHPQPYSPPRNLIAVGYPPQTGKPTASFTLSRGHHHLSGSIDKYDDPYHGQYGDSWAYVQGVNKLYKKVYLPRGRTPIEVDIDVSSDNEQVFLTVLGNPTGTTWEPTIDGSPVSNDGVNYKDRVNWRDLDPFYKGFKGMPSAWWPPVPAQKNVMAGGYHGWAYGDWKSSEPFNPDLIALPSLSKPMKPSEQAEAPFMFVLPNSQGMPTRGVPMWTGRGSGFYIAGGAMKPGVAGGGLLASVSSLRASESVNWDFKVSVYGQSVTYSDGQSQSVLDLIDINGDRYPDLVSRNGVQFNTGDGHFSAAVSLDLDALRETAMHTIRAEASLSPKASVDDKDHLISFVGSDSTTSRVISTNFSVGKDLGISRGDRDLLDLNGDGLPDQVEYGDGGVRARINLGGKFSGWIQWDAAPWTQGDYDLLGLGLISSTTDAVRLDDVGADSVGAGGGYSGPGGGFGLGGGMVYNVSRSIVQMVDVNGDGLPDQVRKVAGAPSGMRVKLNMGTSFGDEQAWALPAWNVDGVNPSHFLFLPSDDALGFQRSSTWNGSGNVDVCYLVFCVSVSFFYASGTNWSQSRFEDVDGDGLNDQVLKLDGNAQVYFKRNTLGGVNLLKQVDRPLGGKIELGYSLIGNRVDHFRTDDKLDMPRGEWALSKVTVDDGRTHRYSDVITYPPAWDGNTTRANLGSGYYDRAEREDYGHRQVITTHGIYANSDGVIWQDGDGSVLKQIFNNQDYYTRGLLSEEYEISPDGYLMRGQKFTYKQPGDRPVRTGTFFPAETDRFTLFYEGSTKSPSDEAPKWKHEGRVFDAEGNLTDLYDDGDEQGDGANHTGPDNVRFHVTYTNESGTHITRASMVQATTNTGVSPQTLRYRSATYYATKGGVKTITDFVYGGKDPSGAAYNGAAATHSFTYDNYGNLLTVTDPKGYALQYGYDLGTQTYRTEVDDLAFGYKSYATPNYLFGTNADTTDINSQKEKYVYDSFGRLSQVFGPNEQAAGSAPTISMTYAPAASVPYAVTNHLDTQHPGDTLDTVLFVDGLGRVIQTKKDVERDIAGNGTTVVGMSVSGQILFDSRGRVAQQGQPTFDTGAATTFVPGTPTNPTIFTYDSLGRTTKVQRPDANAAGGMAVSTTTYGITTSGISAANLEPMPLGLTNSGRWLTTIETDPLSNKHVTYDDSNGRRVAVKQYNVIGAGTTLTALVTQYQHDQLGQLLKVSDAKNNATTSTYDTLGRMVQLVSPDAGTTEYRYDLAGNLGAKITGKLAASNQKITYDYDYDRLKKVNYPNMAAVTYTYGTTADAGDNNGNRAGRVKTVTMEGGSEDRYYDRLGNVNKTETTLIHPKETSLPAQVFKMSFNYDSFGRMQDMTFPNWVKNDWSIMSGDGEKVSYLYDRGGLLNKITGHHQTPNPEQTSHPIDFTYLNHIGYDEFEQRTVLVSGNGIANKYGYDPKTRRLSSLDASTTTRLFHAIRYTYDLVGNITHLENQSNVSDGYASVATGPTKMDYLYDNLYQLKSATGMYRPQPGFGYQYASSFQYDEIGNMTKKSQLESRLVWDNQTPPAGMAALAGYRVDHTVSAFSHTLDYQYTATRPHAASTIVETPAGSTSGSNRVFTYDGSGNNKGNTFSGDTRVQVWDDENRLKEVDRNGGMLGKFLYSPDGERTHKVASAGETFYVNQFYVLQPNRVPTKHIFAGETRIVSKTDAIWMQTPTISNYHPDHLGSSSYTSASDQTLLQHERYFPFGERDIGDQEECDQSRPDGMRRDWLFNSKEYDWDTGLFYFGARYYDARMVTWQSADPILAGYMSGAPNGGVYHPRNLGVYTYAWNRPVVLTDPDGAAVGDPWYERGLKAAFGLVSGAALAVIPGGFLHDPAKSNDDSDFLMGKALGQAVVGAGETYSGANLVGAAVAGEVGTGGLGTLVAVPVAIAGAAVAAQGVGNLEGALTTLQMANNAAANERAGKNAATSGGSGSSADATPSSPGKPALGNVKEAVKEAQKMVGGPQPPGRPGKFGSPQRGTSKKGYRLDPGHPGKAAGDPEAGWHVNWWNYTGGKRGRGGSSGAIPIKRR